MKIYTIGRDQSNNIVLPNNEKISRHHAKLEVYENGAMVLHDYSKNKTTVNGKEIHNSSTAVQRGDLIQFAGVADFDWGQIPGKIRSINSKNVRGWHIALPVLALLLGGFSLWWFGIPDRQIYSETKLNEKYSKSVGLIVNAYYITTKISDGRTVFVGQRRDSIKASFNKENLSPIISAGTGFLIRGDQYLKGNIITNRHVADPSWVINSNEVDDPSLLNLIQTIDIAVTFIENSRGLPNSIRTYETLTEALRFFPEGADFEIEESQTAEDILDIIKTTGYRCVKPKSNFLPNVDLYLLRANNIDQNKFNFISLEKEVQYELEELKPLEPMLLIGFSGGINWNYDNFNKIIESEPIPGKISRFDENSIDYLMECFPGSSGSPIFNNKGKLIGVNSRGIFSGGRCSGVPAYHLMALTR